MYIHVFIFTYASEILEIYIHLKSTLVGQREKRYVFNIDLNCADCVAGEIMEQKGGDSSMIVVIWMGYNKQVDQ